MKTVGQILSKTRLEKGITLEEVSNQTKIRQNILLALEKDDFQKLSSIASVKGFLKTYAEFLGLSGEQILAVFRRDFGRKEKSKIIPQGMFRSIDKKRFNWTPKITLTLLIIIFFFGLISYLSYQYFSLIRTPFLKVISPQQASQVRQETIEVLGKADLDCLVTVNMEPVSLSKNGEFRYKLNLFPGENNIVVVAKSKIGKETKIERTVFFQPEEPER